MRAKLLLADRFREQDYHVVLEERHTDGHRRVDVAVTVPGRHGPERVAVEVQDTAISVNELKRRTNLNRQAGFFATVWVFTSNRLSRVRGGGRTPASARLRRPSRGGGGVRS